MTEAERHDHDYQRAIDQLLLAGKRVLITPDPPACAHDCKDPDDILTRHGPILLEDLIGRARPPDLSLDGEARRLAKISNPLERDRAITEAAKRLKVRVAVLREAVRRYHDGEAGEGPGDASGAAGTLLTFPEITPWPDLVDGAGLLGALVAHLERFAVLPAHGAVTTALWALHCHAFEAAIHTPRLLLTSPLPACGKGQVIGWLAGIVPRPFSVIDPSGPTLFRPIEAHCPCVLVDEADLIAWEDRRDILAVIHAGHTKTGQGIPRCVGESFEVRTFQVWAPLAYAMIGKPRGALLSRSIVLGMERKTSGQSVEYRRLDRDQGFEALRRKAARWAQDHLLALREADSDLPVVGRRADCWRPLIAIALSQSDGESDDVLGLMLLHDLKAIFDEKGEPGLWTEDLLEALHRRLEQPWGELNRGRGLTVRGLARLLKPFGVRSQQVWKDQINKQGYRQKDLAGAWDRYCGGSSPSPSPRTLDPNETATHSGFQSPRGDFGLGDEKPPKATATARSRGLGDRNPLDGLDEASSTANGADHDDLDIPGADPRVVFE